MDVWSCHPFVLLKCIKKISEIAEIYFINNSHHNKQECVLRYDHTVSIHHC